MNGVTYKFKNRGAILSLPNGGHREEVIRTKVFEDYIQDHVVSWFTWAQKNKLGVERMEDLILVTSCTLVTSWAAAVFLDDNMEAEISLESRALNNGGSRFVWNKTRGPVEHRNSPLTSLDQVRSPSYAYSACTDFFAVRKGTHFRSMRLHQGLPSEKRFFRGQTNPSCGRPPS